MLSPVRARSLLAAVVVTIGIACGDAPSPPLLDPYFPTYDLTTSLDSFAFEVPCPPSINGMVYCSRSVAVTSGARLSGPFTLGPAGVASAAFDGAFCDQIDLDRLTGCLHASPVALDLPLPGSWEIRDIDDTTQHVRFSIGNNLGTIALDGVPDGDGFRGRVSWTMISTGFPPMHFGTFIARHRPEP